MSLRDCGFTLVELLVAVGLATLLLGAGWSLLAGQAASASAAVRLSDRLEVVRVVRIVLGEELRAGVGGRDWSAPAGDSVSLRAYRGVALRCGDAASARLDEDELLVRYLGLRAPAPEKDSLLVLGEEGGWRAVPLGSRSVVSDTARVCAGTGDGWRIERWRVPDLPDPFRVGRVFERGSYHLAGAALRYRTGGGGRQPLTPELLDDAASALEVGPGLRPIRIRMGFPPVRSGSGESAASGRGWSVAIWPGLP